MRLLLLSRTYFKSNNMLDGDSKYPFHILENLKVYINFWKKSSDVSTDLAMVAPSMHLWSADQLTFITGVGTTVILSLYRGTV